MLITPSNAQNSLPQPTIKQQEKTFFDLVAQYKEAVRSEQPEAGSLHTRLIQDYGVDFKKKTYRNRPLPLETERLEALATMAFQLYRGDQTAGKKIKSGMSTQAMLLSGSVNLLKRLFEAVKGIAYGLSGENDHPAVQKLMLAKTKELLDFALLQLNSLEDKLEPEQIQEMRGYLGALLEKWPLLEKSLKKKNTGEASQVLSRIDDIIERLLASATGSLRKLFIRKPLAEAATSYQADLAAARADLEGSSDIALHHLEVLGLKVYKEQIASLKALYDKLPKEGESTIQDSFQALDLRIKAAGVFQALVQYIDLKKENAFDHLRI